MTQTGEKTAHTSDIVIMTKTQPMIVSATPKEPNALPFAFKGAATNNGAVAIAPPSTIEASSAPGSRSRNPTFRWSRKRGTQSQKTVDATSHAGSTTNQPVSRSSAEETSASATAPESTKKKIANSAWSAAEPTSIPQARA